MGRMDPSPWPCRKTVTNLNFSMPDQKVAVLKEAGAPEDNIIDQICILGHFFQPSQQRKLHKKEQDRIDASLSLVKRASCLPSSVTHKRLVMATGPLSKIQFGWWMHVPPKNIFDKFQSAIRKALNEPHRSCIHLRDII